MFLFKFGKFSGDEGRFLLFLGQFLMVLLGCCEGCGELGLGLGQFLDGCVEILGQC